MWSVVEVAHLIAHIVITKDIKKCMKGREEQLDIGVLIM